MRSMARVVGVLQQAKGLPDARPALVVDEEGHVWRWVEHAAGLTGAGWVEVDTYVPRESGGSLPGPTVSLGTNPTRFEVTAPAGSPVLNKGGGCASVSEYSGRRCQKAAGHDGMHEDDATRWEDR
jgi:hypothetical protein